MTTMPGADDDAPTTTFYLPDLMRLERRAVRTGTLEDRVAVWAIPFYAQRKYWFKLFIGLNYGIFADVLRDWTLRGIPDSSFSVNVRLYEYLASHAGMLSMEECLGELNLKRITKRIVSQRFSKGITDPHSPSRSQAPGSQRTKLIQSLKSKVSIGSFDLGVRRASGLWGSRNVDMRSIQTDELIDEPRQSKLSQEQLTELQRSTHFDKKELQQWYKGTLFDHMDWPMLICSRLFEGLPLRYAYERGVSKDLPAILPFRRSIFLCGLRVQCL
jgi:hypothetical protein